MSDLDELSSPKIRALCRFPPHNFGTPESAGRALGGVNDCGSMSFCGKDDLKCFADPMVH